MLLLIFSSNVGIVPSVFKSTEISDMILFVMSVKHINAIYGKNTNYKCS
jgi:hypothetical protein